MATGNWRGEPDRGRAAPVCRGRRLRDQPSRSKARAASARVVGSCARRDGDTTQPRPCPRCRQSASTTSPRLPAVVRRRLTLRQRLRTGVGVLEPEAANGDCRDVGGHSDGAGILEAGDQPRDRTVVAGGDRSIGLSSSSAETGVRLSSTAFRMRRLIRSPAGRRSASWSFLLEGFDARNISP